jgi:general secretion pathway protein D
MKASLLSVRDGETNILAGLIQRDERRSNTGVPGLNEVPLISKLFGAAQDSDNRTEIVLLATPHIVRNIDLPGIGLQEFLSGTESAIGASPIQLGTPAPAPAASGAARPQPPAPAGQLQPSVPMAPAAAPPPLVAPPIVPTAPSVPPALQPSGAVPSPAKHQQQPGTGG